MNLKTVVSFVLGFFLVIYGFGFCGRSKCLFCARGRFD